MVKQLNNICRLGLRRVGKATRLEMGAARLGRIKIALDHHAHAAANDPVAVTPANRIKMVPSKGDKREENGIGKPRIRTRSLNPRVTNRRREVVIRDTPSAGTRWRMRTSKRISWKGAKAREKERSSRCQWHAVDDGRHGVGSTRSFDVRGFLTSHSTVCRQETGRQKE